MPDWKPIAEHPRESGGYVLVYDGCLGRITVAKRAHDGKWFADRDYAQDCEVSPTHWMPLPSPPPATMPMP